MGWFTAAAIGLSMIPGMNGQVGDQWGGSTGGVLSREELLAERKRQAGASPQEANAAAQQQKQQRLILVVPGIVGLMVLLFTVVLR